MCICLYIRACNRYYQTFMWIIFTMFPFYLDFCYLYHNLQQSKENHSQVFHLLEYLRHDVICFWSSWWLLPLALQLFPSFFFHSSKEQTCQNTDFTSPPHGKPVIIHQKRCKHAAERASTQSSCIQTVAPSQLTLPQRGIAFMGLWKSHKWCHISIYTYIMYIVNIMCFGMILVGFNTQTMSEGFSNYSSSTRTLILYTVLHNHPSACAHYDF